MRIIHVPTCDHTQAQVINSKMQGCALVGKLRHGKG